MNTEKTRLDGQVKESNTTIKKLKDELKEVDIQLEDSKKNNATLEQRLSEMQEKIQNTEIAMKKIKEEMKVKLKENTQTIESKRLCLRIKVSRNLFVS